MKKLPLTKGLKWLALSAFLLLITLGGWLLIGLLINPKNRSITVKTAAVTEDKVEDKITGESGIIKLNNQRDIKSVTTGTVEQILVKSGDIVTKGQILIRLRDKEAQLKLQEFQSDLQDKALQLTDKRLSLQRAETKLVTAQQEYQVSKQKVFMEIEKLKQDKLWEIEKSKLEVIKKQKSLEIATNNLSQILVKLEEDKQLFERGFIAETEIENSQKNVIESEVNLNNAKDELQIANINLSKQQLDLQSFVNEIKQGSSEPQQKFKESQAKVEETQDALNQAKSALNQTIREQKKLEIERQKIIEETYKNTIISPVNGMILSVKVKVGDVVEPNTNLILIGDASQQIVELKLNPLDATKIQPQQKAEVSLVGSQAEKITGKVQEVSLLAGDEQDNNNNYNSDSVKVTAIVSLDQSHLKIVPGTPVTVDLIVSRRENVMTLPNEAIQKNDSETFVWIKDIQGQAAQKVIKIGLQGLENTEIKSGLKSGDEVLIPFLDAGLQDGDFVKIKQDSSPN